MTKMNRRNFFKFMGKGAAIAGLVATVGLPEQEPQVEEEVRKDEFTFSYYDGTTLVNESASGNPVYIESNGTLYVSGQFTQFGETEPPLVDWHSIGDDFYGEVCILSLDATRHL